VNIRGQCDDLYIYTQICIRRDSLFLSSILISRRYRFEATDLDIPRNSKDLRRSWQRSLTILRILLQYETNSKLHAPRSFIIPRDRYSITPTKSHTPFPPTVIPKSVIVPWPGNSARINYSVEAGGTIQWGALKFNRREGARPRELQEYRAANKFCRGIPIRRRSCATWSHNSPRDVSECTHDGQPMRHEFGLICREAIMIFDRFHSLTLTPSPVLAIWRDHVLAK